MFVRCTQKNLQCFFTISFNICTTCLRNCFPLVDGDPQRKQNHIGRGLAEASSTSQTQSGQPGNCTDMREIADLNVHLLNRRDEIIP